MPPELSLAGSSEEILPQECLSRSKWILLILILRPSGFRPERKYPLSIYPVQPAKKFKCLNEIILLNCRLKSHLSSQRNPSIPGITS